MAQYSVRIGKTTTPSVYVRTPNGHIVAYHRRFSDRNEAKQLASAVRRRLAGGGRLSKQAWTRIR